MTHWEELSGRRKYERFSVPRDTLALIEGSSATVAHVLDIGVAGLAFSYGAENECRVESSAIHVFLSTSDFYLESVPFETVWDMEMLTEPPLSQITRRRRGVKFRKLTALQLSQLQYFIKNFATGLSND